jgi:hypothetical protein
LHCLVVVPSFFFTFYIYKLRIPRHHQNATRRVDSFGRTKPVRTFLAIQQDGETFDLDDYRTKVLQKYFMQVNVKAFWPTPCLLLLRQTP